MNKKPSGTAGLFSLLHTAQSAQDHVEARLDTIGLSLAKLAALNVLAEAGDALPLGQLADRLACVKSNITQLVDRLEADGLVTRQAAPNDRRARLAVMTATGKKAWKKGMTIQENGERELFKRLSRAEAKTLATLMSKVTANP
jgi:DNA-binding MarR family transcriptional regulator